MRLYCPREVIQEIILVNNSSSSSAHWLNDLMGHYGDLAGAVRVIPGADIAPMPPGTDGWLSQQVLKIKVAEVLLSKRYVLLDAKNHFIKQLNWGVLETPSGRPRMQCHSYAGHGMLEYLQNTLNYLGIDVKEHVGSFPRTHPPFTMYTHEARELIQFIERREHEAFASVFLGRRLSEFFLYSGFLISKGTLHQLYDMSPSFEPQIWPGNAGARRCSEVISMANQHGCPFMTVHRRALEKMDKQGQRLLAEFWHARNLFASAEDGLRFLRDPNRCHQNCEGSVVSWPVSAFLGRLSIGAKRPRSSINDHCVKA